MTVARYTTTRPSLTVMSGAGNYDHDRMLPADIDAERATLGALLIDRDAIIAVAPWLQSEHFYLEKHAWVYNAVLTCYNSQVPPDIRTISDHLRRHKQLDAIGGIPYLVELSIATPTAVHIGYYGKIVEQTANLRRLIAAGGEIAALGYNETLDESERISLVEEVLQKALTRPGAYSVTSAAEAVNELFATLSAGTANGIATGIRHLDDKTDGLHRGDLILIAGRPGMGKTSFALQLLQNVSERNGTALLFSLEMSKNQLLQRMLASRSGVDLMALRRQTMTEEQLRSVVINLGKLAQMPFYLDDTAALTVEQLRAKAMALHASLSLKGEQLDLIIVDYLQLMTPSDLGRRSGTRAEDVSTISRKLKQLARELNVPIIALAQLNRAVETRPNRIPMLSDLRDSGSLEQDADLVMFLYREEVYDARTERKGIAQVHIAKHRNGPLGVISLQFHASTQRWHDLE